MPAATMSILGWKAIGFRCPDHEVDFTANSDTVYPVTFLQMPNGTGKTTTLSLLRLALSGKASATDGGDGISPEQVREFRKRNSRESTGQFEVRLLLNGKRATIIMKFDFDSGSVQYFTTHGSGQKNGFEPPIIFKKFLNPNFVEFFVFDGELADHLLSREHTDAESVVERLFQVDTLQTMRTRVEDYWE